MTQIYDLQQRADVLRKKTATDSISPEEVGGLHADTLAYIANMERYASSLGIKKVYTSVSEMNGDESPVSSTGMPLKAGQLVTIFNAEAPDAENSGEIYAFQNPGWVLVGRLDAGTADTLKKLIEGDKATVTNNNRNAFVWLGNFETWAEAQTEIDKLHATGEDNTKVGEFRLLLNGRNLIVRNFVQNWATGVFTQTIQGSIQWNVETQTMDQSLKIKTYERRYNEGTGWTTWEEGAAKIELAQELSTEEGSEKKAISQKAVSIEIKKITTPLEKELKEEYSYNYISNSEFNGILRKDNSISDYDGYKSSDYIAIPKTCTKIITENVYPIQNALCGFLLLSTDKTVIAYFGGSNEIDIKDYPNASFFRYTSAASGNLKGRITVYSTNIDYEKLSDIEKNSTIIDSLVKYSDELEHISIINKKSGRGPSALGGVLQGYNYPVEKDSRLLQIEVSEGTYQIGDTVDIYTGLIDQLGFFIVDSIFTGEVSYIDELTGNRTITPVNDITIRAGNSIFIKGNKYKWLSPDESTETKDKYGLLHTLSPDNNYTDATTPNNIATFVVKLKEIIYKNYVTSDELTEVENKIDSLSQQFILTDRATGKNYKLIVYNGELQAKSLQYDKILCIGNSFTYSPHRPSWLAEEGRGMAASVTSSQYTEMLKISTGGIVDKLFGRNFEYAASNIEGFDFESELPINATIMQLLFSWVKIIREIMSHGKHCMITFYQNVPQQTYIMLQDGIRH